MSIVIRVYCVAIRTPRGRARERKPEAAQLEQVSGMEMDQTSLWKCVEKPKAEAEGRRARCGGVRISFNVFGAGPRRQEGFALDCGGSRGDCRTCYDTGSPGLDRIHSCNDEKWPHGFSLGIEKLIAEAAFADL